MAQLRRLTADDASALSAFSCRTLGEPWTDALEDTIRRHLAPNLGSHGLEGVGCWDGDELVGVAAWRVWRETDPILARGDVVAVATGHRLEGHGRALKEAVIAATRAAGAACLLSYVDSRNTGMLVLNEKLGAEREDDPDDTDYVKCVIRL